MPNLLLVISGVCIVAYVLRETLEDLQKKKRPKGLLQTVYKKLFSPRRGRIAFSANERIAEFLDFAIQAKFADVNKLRQGGIRCPPEIIIHTKTKNQKRGNYHAGCYRNHL